MDDNLGQVERSIASRREDRLERAGFVGRIADALVAPANQLATGVVIGVTGSWGSGKSSILNMVEEELKEREPETVTVRFDPWLISGRDDLIGAFFHELSAAMKLKKSKADGISDAIQAIDGYVGHLAPVFDLFMPHLGKLLKAGVGGAARLSRKDGSLKAARDKVTHAMSKIKTPVVVLIDELDRVEDAEVRIMAQLVRSVADFPNVSYLLAYDAPRVAEALGGKPGDTDGRGRAYLEKIVQLPIPIPILMPEEVARLISSELDRVHATLGVSTDRIRPGDHDRIIDAIVPYLISTPRDVKRMTGAYQALAGMLGSEVDLADVFGFAALSVKSPRTVELIRSDAEGYVVDPLGFDENVRRSQAQPPAILRVATGDEGAQRLMLRLFPALGGQVAVQDLYSDAIGLRRGLLTSLRLGVLPGDGSREAAEALLSANANTVQQAFEKALQDDTVGSLMDRIDAIYGSRSSGNDLGFWTGASRFLDDPGPSPEVTFTLKRELADALSRMMINAVKRRPDLRNKAFHIFQTLRQAEDLSLASRWLNQHLSVHGAMNAPHDGGAGWFIAPAQIEAEVNAAAQNWSGMLYQQRLLPRLADALPLLLMRRVEWSDSHKEALTMQGSQDIDRMARIFFGRPPLTDRATIDALIGWATWLGWAEHRQRDPGVPDDVKAAFARSSEAAAQAPSEA